MPRSMSRQRRTALRGVAAALASASLLAGCGAGTTRVSGHVVTVRLDEYRIVPQSVSVPAGRLEIVAINRGILTHDIALERARRDVEGQPPLLGATGIIMPGARGSMTVTLRRPGRYELVSTIANQADLGMYGTLIVR